MAKREILFRGWNKKNKKWLYGYYCVNRGEHFIAPDEFVNPLASYEAVSYTHLRAHET